MSLFPNGKLYLESRLKCLAELELVPSHCYETAHHIAGITG